MTCRCELLKQRFLGSGPCLIAGALMGVALAASLCVVPPAAAQTIDWVAGTGNWNTATNWSPQNVPNGPGESARFPIGGGTYTTTLDASPTLDGISILNTGTTLNIGTRTLTLLLSPGISNDGIVSSQSGTATIHGSLVNGATGIFRILGGCHIDLYGPTVANSGQFVVNSNGLSSNADLTVVQSTEFSGPGEIYMLSATSTEDAILYTGTGAVLTNAADHTIRGTGSIYGGLTNHGRIAGGGTSYGLTLGSAAKTNNGTMETLSGGLLIVTTGIDQSSGGRIVANDGTVRLTTGALVTGGTITSTGTGTVECTASTPYLVDVTNEGEIKILSSVLVGAQGSSLTNDGIVRINANNLSGNSSLNLSGGLVLQGTGEIAMLQAGSVDDASIIGAAGTWATHAAGHTIHGGGSVSRSLDNFGVIRADQSGRGLQLDMPGLVNDGLLSAASGGILAIVCDSVMQTPSGRILADGGTVRLVGAASVTGGTLESTAGSQIHTYSGTVSLADIRSVADWRLKPGTITNLGGSVIRNDATITVNEGTSVNTYLRAIAPLALTGEGEVVLQCASDPDDAEFSSTGGASVTQASDHTIRGIGRVSTGLVNDGTVLADLGGVGLVLSGQPKTNRALFRAAPSGKMTIEYTTVTQEGAGRIVADDGQVILSDAGIIGGTLQSSGSGYLRSTTTSRITSLINQGDLRIAGGTILEMAGGSIQNDGTIQINDTGSSGNCYLRAQETMTLDGSGEVRLRTGGAFADANLATVAGATLTIGPDQEVRGEGYIQASLVNRGTVSGDVVGKTLFCGANGQTNEGTMRATAGGNFGVYSGRLVNNALVEAADTSRVRVYGGVLENQADLVARESGTVQVEGGLLENHSLARAFGEGTILQTNGSFRNYGTLRAEADGEVKIDLSVEFKNLGIAEATSGGLVWCDRWADHYANGRFYDGSWRVSGTGQMRLIGANIQTLDAEIILDGPDSRIWSDEGVTDALAGMTAIGSGGAFELRNARSYTRGGNLASAGQIRLPAGTSLTVSGRFRQTLGSAVASVDGVLTSPDSLKFEAGFLRGNGRVVGNVWSQATVEPGASVGHLTIEGEYKQRMNGAISIELGGMAAGASDLLEITGAANFGGGIKLRVANGYQPQEGDAIEIVRFASRTGDFTQRDICPAPGVCAELVWNPTSLVVVMHRLPTSDVEEPEDSETPEEPQEPAADQPVVEEGGAVPDEFRLDARLGFDGGAVLILDLPEPSSGSVEIYDVAGRRVLTAAAGPWSAGSHSIRWTGEIEGGGRAPRGVYFARARLSAPDGSIERRARFVLIR